MTPASAAPVGSHPAGSAVAALALLAVALLVADGRTTRGRLHALTASPPVTPSTAVALRPSWIVVGAVALGALGWAVAGPAPAVVVGGGAGLAGGLAARVLAARAGHPRDDDAALAAVWELVAVCLEAGLPVPAAVAAAAEPLNGRSGVQLRRVAGLLELGADPADAWRSVEGIAGLAAFARAAGRSAGTGTALAQVSRAESTRLRAALVDTAQARAQRAAVHITGPLGLCFLPAFLVLGIAPVVVGLAGEALAQW